MTTECQPFVCVCGHTTAQHKHLYKECSSCGCYYYQEPDPAFQLTGEQWDKWFAERGLKICPYCLQPHKAGSTEQEHCEWWAKHAVVDDGHWAKMWGD